MGTQTGFPRSLEEERSFFPGYWGALADEFGLDMQARSALHAFDYALPQKPYPDVRPACCTPAKPASKWASIELRLPAWDRRCRGGACRPSRRGLRRDDIRASNPRRIPHRGGALEQRRTNASSSTMSSPALTARALQE